MTYRENITAILECCFAGYKKEIIDSACNCILELEPKTGHWIKSSIGGAKICSICQAHMGLSNFKYCPACGVKMVESEDEK